MLVGPDWKITTDALNFIVAKRHVSRNGRERWAAVGFYGRLSGALGFILDQNVRDTRLSDLAAVNQKVDELRAWFEEALDHAPGSPCPGRSEDAAIGRQLEAYINP